ncbi:MAG: hypothetical protein V4722_23530 [Bacteroidota bacterium]
MQQTILLRDETASGKIISELTISFDKEIITVQELITARVHAEVDVYNKTMPEYYRGLVQPTDAEKVLNGFKLRDRRKVDAEKQAYIALGAFQKNGYFILVNDKQVSDLKEMISLSATTTVSFVKLTPLVGG